MSKRLQLTIAQAAVGTLGIFHTIIGFTMIAMPAWFFENIGNFPPFNRHYLGDFGAYQLPLGLALIVASRRPFQHRLLIGAVIVANVLHAFNHIYDDLADGFSFRGDTIALFVIGLVYVALLFMNPQTSELGVIAKTEEM